MKSNRFLPALLLALTAAAAPALAETPEITACTKEGLTAHLNVTVKDGLKEHDYVLQLLRNAFAGVAAKGEKVLTSPNVGVEIDKLYVSAQEQPGARRVSEKNVVGVIPGTPLVLIDAGKSCTFKAP